MNIGNKVVGLKHADWLCIRTKVWKLGMIGFYFTRLIIREIRTSKRTKFNTVSIKRNRECTVNAICNIGLHSEHSLNRWWLLRPLIFSTEPGKLFHVFFSSYSLLLIIFFLFPFGIHERPWIPISRKSCLIL